MTGESQESSLEHPGFQDVLLYRLRLPMIVVQLETSEVCAWRVTPAQQAKQQDRYSRVPSECRLVCRELQSKIEKDRSKDQ